MKQIKTRGGDTIHSGAKNKKRGLRLLPLALVMVVMVSLLGGCKLTEEKAIQIYKDSIENAGKLESGKIDVTGEITVNLDETAAMEMDMKLQGTMKDKGKTGAIQVEMNALGQSIPMQIYMKDGDTYVQMPNEEKYTHSNYEDMTGMSYDQLLSFGQVDMKEIYFDAVDTATDLTFGKEEGGNVKVAFSITDQARNTMQEKLKTMMLDQMMPQMEKQIRAQLEGLDGAAPGMDGEGWTAMLEEQIKATIEMEKQILAGMSFDKMAMETTITKDGFMTNQKMDFVVGLDLQALSDILGAAGSTEALPKNCTIGMILDCNVTEINQEIPIEMPEFTDANTIESSEQGAAAPGIAQEG